MVSSPPPASGGLIRIKGSFQVHDLITNSELSLLDPGDLDSIGRGSPNDPCQLLFEIPMLRPE